MEWLRWSLGDRLGLAERNGVISSERDNKGLEIERHGHVCEIVCVCGEEGGVVQEQWRGAGRDDLEGHPDAISLAVGEWSQEAVC